MPSNLRQRPLIHNPRALQRRRIAAGLNQKTLADLADITEAFMSQILSGQRSASPDTLTRLAAALDCPVEDLMADDAPNPIKDDEASSK